MLIESLSLNNFRQYKGSNYIQFSTDPKRNVTVITGKNTCGKTTLVQSFIWCLYGKLDFKDKDILNAEAKEQLENSTIGAVKSAFVVVRLIHNNKEYLIERKEEYVLEKEKKIKRTQSFRIYEIDENSNAIPVEADNYYSVITDILPENLSDYFFFWGERIEKLSEKKELTSAVKQFLGLDTMDAAIRHLNSTVNKLIKDAGSQSNDANIEKLSKKITELESQNSIIEIRIKNHQDNIQYYKAKADQLFEDLTTSENKELQTRQNEYKNKLSQLQTKTKELENSKTNYFKHFNDESNYVYLLSSCSERKAVEMLKANPEPVVGWNYIDVNAINEIIKRGECICGNKFCNGDKTYTYLIDQRKLVAPNLVGGVINSFIEESERRDYLNKRYYELLREDYIRINKLSDEILDLQYDVDKLSKYLAGKSDLKAIHKKYDEMLEEETKAREALSVDNAAKKRNDEEITRCTNSINALIERNKKFLRQSRAIDYARRILEMFKEDYNENVTDIKAKLEEYVNKNFEEVYSGDRKIKIDEKYNAIALNKVGSIWITSETSPGLETVKNFAFIAGLVQCAKEKIIGGDGEEKEANENSYPLVLDAPFSQADEKHIPAISKLISNNAEQIILVVMEKDWNYAKDVLDNKVGKMYNLEKVSETQTYIKEDDIND